MNSATIKLFADAHPLEGEYQGTFTFFKGLYSVLLNNYPELDIYFGTANPDRVQEHLPQVNSDRLVAYTPGKPSFYRYLVDIPRLLGKTHFDFAHYQYLLPLGASDCHSVVTLHDVVFNDYKAEFPFLYRQLRKTLFGRSIKKASIKTTVSEYSKKQIARHYQINADQIHVLANGIESGFINEENIDDGYAYIQRKYKLSNYLLLVSRCEPRKNHALLLRAYLDLQLYNEGISLVFIGKRSLDVPQLNRMIDQLSDKQRQHFHWLEQVGDQDLRAFYKACRVFVYPSKAEGFGIPPLEAGICEVPVLCSSATAMEAFRFFDPYRFDPQNEGELKQKLLSLLHAPPPADHLKQIAHLIRQRYSWNQSAETFYNLLTPNEKSQNSHYGYPWYPKSLRWV